LATVTERSYPDMWVEPQDDPRETSRPPRGEREVVLDYLRRYRLTFEMKCADLDPAQMALRSVPPSTLSLRPGSDEAVSIDEDSVEVRDILVHLVEEYARHVGHADLLRQCIDGRTGQ
jgi:hypothetical protein